MLVKCKKAFRHQTTENNTYLVMEVSIQFSYNSKFYRIIDNEGYPALYKAENFEIVSNEYNNCAVLLNDRRFVLSHKDIINSSLNNKNINGFWGGCFIEDDVEAIKIVNNVVKELSLQEHFEVPERID